MLLETALCNEVGKWLKFRYFGWKRHSTNSKRRKLLEYWLCLLDWLVEMKLCSFVNVASTEIELMPSSTPTLIQKVININENKYGKSNDDKWNNKNNFVLLCFCFYVYFLGVGIAHTCHAQYNRWRRRRHATMFTATALLLLAGVLNPKSVGYI